MTLVSIREQVGTSDGPNATLSFNHGEAFSLTISDPFSEQQEKLLEWYFEEHVRFPFTGQAEAQKAAQSITAYGEALFKQVFADRRTYVLYQEALQAGVGTLTFEIAGSPDFHRLHWEALKDPDLPQPLALYAPMVRHNLLPQSARANLRPSPTINLLIVTARPAGPRDVGYRTMSRPMVQALRKAGPPVEIEILRPGTYAALLQHLKDVRAEHGSGYYHVVHLDVHGALLSYDELEQGRESERFLFQARYGRDDVAPYEGHKAFFFLEGAQEGQADPVEASELADLLTAHQMPIAILSACRSGRQVGAMETSLGNCLMEAGVQMVLDMGPSITVSAAELMIKSLYERLFAGHHLSSAMRRARIELYNRKGRRVYFDQTVDLEDWLLPVVYQNREQRLELREFTPEQGAAYYERRARRYREPHTGYGFVGRDVDVLQIERRLLGQAPGAGHNLLLLRGMGGVGKTTLLHHLAAWWRITGFVERVFYFGYDEWAWTRQQIMARIAKRLLGEAGYASNFQPLNPEAQQDLLTQRLRARRYLLILDNVESITGAHLAIRHTLPIAERVALRSFLSDLADGETLVLLGSRGGEEWLMDEAEAFGDAPPPLHPEDVYELPGLDPEAASTLAGRVLEWHGVSAYREDADFRQLLDLLQGYPLALEVVLANLSRQTPAEVLSALQAGDAALEQGQSKAESILRCIDFAHSNLSPETQGLLLCLAPFTAVLWEDMLEKYTARLWEQPALSDLPFERWPQVLQEAADWGLFSPHPDLSGFMRLQPVLPYFLKHRLAAPEQAEVRGAIETAFRRHYDRLSRTMAQLINSQEAEEKQLGQVLVRLEYENLSTALNLALASRVSVLHFYAALSGYLQATQDHQREMKLGQTVLARLDDYPAEALTGQSGAEFVAVLDAIARYQLTLKQYDTAEACYQKTLELVARLEKIDQERQGKMEASVYHQLGVVAGERRQWAQAEGYFHQALQAFIEFDDHHAQASVYHQLGTVAQEEEQWAQARDYFLRALETYAAHQDSHQTGMVLRSLAQLWQASEDASLPSSVASVLVITVEKANKRLRDLRPDRFS